MEDNFNEFDFDEILHMVRLHHKRVGDEVRAGNGEVFRIALVCFAVDLPDETSSKQTVIDEFAMGLCETPPIVHAVKFEDPLLRDELGQRAAEIYTLEMKLRRVLSLVYLYAYQTGDPYDLLKEETVQPMARERATSQQMKAAVENQFFHLTFGNYVDLNHRPELRLQAILQLVRTAEQYETFRAEVVRSPVEQEDDAVLLAGLKERMDAIERMRNCVAHNRHPTKTMTDNYLNALPLVNQLIEQYLDRWRSAM